MFEKLFENRSDEQKSNTTDWTLLTANDLLTTSKSQDLYYCRCLNALGNSIAKIPIEIKKDGENGREDFNTFYLNDVLRLRMSNYFTPFETIKSFIMTAKDKGRAGLYIVRENGFVRALLPVQVSAITVDDVGILSNSLNKILVTFSFDSMSYDCLDKDIILLRDNTFNDPFRGKNNDSYVNKSVDTNVEALKYQAKLFKGGMTNKAVIQLSSDIKEESELKRIQRKFSRLLSANTDGEDGSNRIFTIPAGYSLTPINLKLVDSQFAELKLQGKQDICNAIGVPLKLVDGTITEDEMNNYYSNEIQPQITHLEQEFNYKLLLPSERSQGIVIRFNLQAVLRTSLQKQMEIITGYVKNGVYTPNEGREFLNKPRVIGGDEITLPSGQITLSQLLEGKASWQKGNDSNGKEE